MVLELGWFSAEMLKALCGPGCSSQRRSEGAGWGTFITQQGNLIILNYSKREDTPQVL